MQHLAFYMMCVVQLVIGFPCNRLANFNAPAIATSSSSRTRGKFKVQNFDVCYSTAWQLYFARDVKVYLDGRLGLEVSFPPVDFPFAIYSHSILRV